MLPFKYKLSEMKSEDGSALRYKAEELACRAAILVSKDIERTECFNSLRETISSPRLIVYFQYFLKREFFPVVCEGLVLDWYRRNGIKIPSGNWEVIVLHSGVFAGLKRYWPVDVPLKTIPSWKFYAMNKELAARMVFRYFKKSFNSIVSQSGRVFRPRQTLKRFAVSPEGMIACHFDEGIDVDKRNDISWFFGSGIDPKQMLIYFNMLDVRTKVAVSREATKRLDKEGISWVVLKKGVVEDGDDHYWSPRVNALRPAIRYNAKSPLERWIYDKACGLIRSIHYWQAFYNDFNVRIHHITGDAIPEHIAYAIAFDSMPKKAGLLVGKQRSELYALHSHEVGYHPKHVFFTWNKRGISYLKNNYDRIEQFVVTGHPYVPLNDDSAKECAHYAESIKNQGAKFITAFFDNMHDVYSIRSYSSRLMTRFFEQFLKLVIEDPTFGLIIKSKKPAVIEGLPAIHGMLSQAIATGRCVKLDPVCFRMTLPLSIALNADLSVAIGISSTIIEIAAAGLKGVLYDVQTIPSHEFYAWGDRNIMFNDLDQLMSALARYRTDPKSVPKFGDWSAHIGKIDHFHDSRGSARLGQYMRLLLEGIVRFGDRPRALAYARDEYTKVWGADTVFELPSRNGK